MLDMWHRGLQTRVQRRGRSRAVDLVTTGFLGPRVRCLGPNRCAQRAALVSYMPLAVTASSCAKARAEALSQQVINAEVRLVT